MRVMILRGKFYRCHHCRPIKAAVKVENEEPKGGETEERERGGAKVDSSPKKSRPHKRRERKRFQVVEGERAPLFEQI